MNGKRRQYLDPAAGHGEPGTRVSLKPFMRVQYETPDTIYRGYVLSVDDRGMVTVICDTRGRQVFHPRSLLIVPCLKADERTYLQEAEHAVAMAAMARNHEAGHVSDGASKRPVPQRRVGH